ncbi:MAG: transaminase, partial [Chloroflexota bacterium]
MTTINRDRLRLALAAEREHFTAGHPRSKALFERAKKSLLAGVPMNWMVRWAGDFPVFVKEAGGAHFTDVDGHLYLDLCLGDTGAMTGHAPRAVTDAVAAQARRGITFMLPTEESVWVGEELTRRFGLPYWQMTLTATDANRFAIRLARHITKRKLILVFNWCYHGTVDETFVTLKDGLAGPRPGNIGPAVNPAETTRVIEFNDVPALEAALAPGDVACVLAEPAMTNIGIVHPEAGYHDALREITRRAGTLLIVDETHTICAGPGGYTAAHGLKPDMLTIGKPIAGGVPAAVYGMSAEVAERIRANTSVEEADTGGIGGTLAGNALSLAAMKATLQHVLTSAAYDKTIPLAERFEQGVEAVIEEYQLPWIVKRLGCRAEYWFRESPPR